MSQSAFKSSQTVASSKYSSSASRIADLAGSSIKSVNITASRGDSDLQMHPLLFQAPQNGHLPYYPVNCSTSTCSSFAFFKGKQPQLSLGLFHNPRHIRDAVNFLDKSSKPPEKNVPSLGVDFHPLLQRSDDVGTHSIVESRQRCALTQNPSAGLSREGNELELNIHLSFTSKNQEDVERSDTTIHGTGRLRSGKDSGKKGDSARDGTSAELSLGDIPLVTCRNKGIRKVSDTMGDESLPGIIMEQEELSDPEEEFGENVEFECEEMDDSERDSMSDSEQIAKLRNEEVQLDEMDADIDAQMLNTQTDVIGNNQCSTSGGHSSGLLEESTEKGG